MTAEIRRIRRAARQAITKGSNLIQIGVNTVFSSSAKQPTFFGFKFEFAALVQNMALLFFYREFTKFATEVSFFVLVASAVATVGPGAPSPPNDCLCPPILVHSECFFGASRNDKTTCNNGKRNNHFQT